MNRRGFIALLAGLALIGQALRKKLIELEPQGFSDPTRLNGEILISHGDGQLSWATTDDKDGYIGYVKTTPYSCTSKGVTIVR